jgi:hypothetical protein
MTGKRLLYALAAILLALIAIIWIINRAAGPDTESVASAALKGIREQRRFGLSARKTLIMQGLVRYEVDLAKLASNDVRWDSGANTLRVRISDIEVSRPQIDLGSIQEYGDGGILIALTDADRSLDTANRAKGERELIEQARGPVPMRLARDATRRAIAQNFAVPLKAAGIEARVEAKFGDEMVGKVDTRWDLSTPLEEIVRK